MVMRPGEEGKGRNVALVYGKKLQKLPKIQLLKETHSFGHRWELE
jgi:hypothetical protein